MGTLLRQGPLKSLTLRLVHHEPPKILNYMLDFPTLTLISMEFSALVSCDSLYLPIHNFGGSSLPYDLSFLTFVKAIVDFSVSLVFHLLGQNGIF